MCVCVCARVKLKDLHLDWEDARARGSHHVRLLSRLALRAGLAAVAGLVEELVLATAGILSVHQHTPHLETQQSPSG